MTHRIAYPWLMLTLASGVMLMVTPAGTDAAVQSSDRAAALAVNEVAAVDGGFRLNHPGHRASFLAEGVHVSPPGGSPNWSWRLARVGPEGSNASVVDAKAAKPSQPDDLVVRYDRLALDEEYVLGMSAIEQRFIFHVPPALNGRDLVLEGMVSCDGDFTVSPHGWEWRGDGGLVWLGPVIVFDANGDVLPSDFTVTAGRTRLVVDGAALAGAAYPVTIDPEIGANDFRISDMGTDGNPSFDAAVPAIAFNETENEYLVVWMGDSDHAGLVDGETEIFGQLLDASGNPIHINDIRISDVGGTGDPDFDALFPDVVWNSTRNEYFVVWMADDPKDGTVDDEFEIWGQSLDADGNAVGPQNFRISYAGPAGDPYYAASLPAVAYNPIDREYLVVWTGENHLGGLADNEFEIWGQRVGWTGVFMGARFRISDMGGTGDPDFNAYQPDVVHNELDNEYLVVWHGDDDSDGLVDGENEIYGQLTDATGTEIGPNDFRLSDMGDIGDSEFDGALARVAYNSVDNEYLVVWAGTDSFWNLDPLEGEIYSQLLTADLVELGVDDQRLSDVGGIGDPDYHAVHPQVAFNAATREYAVVWYGDDNVGGTVDEEREVFCQLLTADAEEVGPNDERITDIGGVGDPIYGVQWGWVGPRGGVVANSNNGEFLAVWSADDPAGGITDDEFEIFGQRLIGGGVVFSDGFESGATTAWSETVP